MNIIKELSLKINNSIEMTGQTCSKRRKKDNIVENAVAASQSNTIFTESGECNNVESHNQNVSVFDTVSVPCPQNKISEQAMRSGLLSRIKKRTPAIGGKARLKYIKYEKLLCGNMTCDVVELAKLAEDIRRQGMLIPITVVRIGRNAYKVIEGNRRILAGKMLDMKEFLCLVLPENAQIAIDRSSCIAVPDFEQNWLDFCKKLWKDGNALNDPCGFEENDRLRAQCVLVGALADKNSDSLPRLSSLFSRIYGKIALLDDKHRDSAIDELKIGLEGLEMSINEYVKNPKIKRKAKERVIFKDIAVVFNSIENTAERLKLSGGEISCVRSETDSEYLMHIVVKKP